MIEIEIALTFMSTGQHVMSVFIPLANSNMMKIAVESNQNWSLWLTCDALYLQYSEKGINGSV